MVGRDKAFKVLMISSWGIALKILQKLKEKNKLHLVLGKLDVILSLTQLAVKSLGTSMTLLYSSAKYFII
jgi:hypothetical protein